MTKTWFYRQFVIFSVLIIAVFNTAKAVDYVPGELLIKLKNDSAKSLNKSLREFNTKVEQKLQLLTGDVYVVNFGKSMDMEKMAKLISEKEEVEYAEPNYIWKMIEPIDTALINNLIFGNEQNLTYQLNDPKFNKLWGLKNTGNNDPSGLVGIAGTDISAIAAWELTTGSRSVKIAVIDTGIDYNHQDLRDNLWVNLAEKNGTPGVDDDNNGFIDDVHGYDFANKDGDPLDGHGHGTHCAGTIGAVHNNNEGVAGVMGNVELVAIKFLTDTGSGASSDAILSVDYATRMGVDVMSNSWGGGSFSQGLFDAIKNARDAGIIFVAAAGNSSQNNDNGAHYPSSYEVDNVISVASHTIADRLSSFSCYGNRSVDIAAPGSNILSTFKGGQYKSYSGTSMATPHVAGSLGLMISHVGRLAHDEMRERLVMTSVYSNSYRGKLVSSGRLNVYNLLTDTRPERPWEPGENDWIKVPLAEVFESEHPYAPNTELKRTITVPDAKLIRVRFRKLDLENKYDYVKILSSTGALIQKMSGRNQENVASDMVPGETLDLIFSTDRSVQHWGFVIDEVEVIYEIPENL